MKRRTPKSSKAKSVSSKATKAATPRASDAPSSDAPAEMARAKPMGDVVGAIFQNDADVREAVAGGLKTRSIEAKAFTSRATQAFASFKPTKYPTQPKTRAHYLKPGDSLTSAQHTTITQGIEALRESSVPRSLKLGETAGLKALMKPAPANDQSIVGTVALDDLISYIDTKAGGQTFVARAEVITACRAEIEAERRMQAILGSDGTVAPPPANDATPVETRGGDHQKTDGLANEESTLTAAKMVKENVDLQMGTATSPESQLRYTIPDRSKQLETVRKNIDTFELRAGPSDVTSYHDFHNLQIAFEDVWTELFDAKVGNLGKQLYEEYVRLKNFTGVDDGKDHTVSSIDDLRRLMDEIRDFSRITVDSIPPALQPNSGKDSKQDGGRNVVNDVIDVVNTIVNPAGALVDVIMKAFSGQEGALTWDSFKTNLPLGDIITYTIEPDKLPKTIVEFVLIAGPSSSGHVGLIYEDKKTKGQWPIQTASRGVPATLSLAAFAVDDGLIHFRRTTSPFITNGVYNLHIDAKAVKPGSRVTFTWLKDGDNYDPNA